MLATSSGTSNLVVRVLAIVGVLFLLERAASLLGQPIPTPSLLHNWRTNVSAEIEQTVVHTVDNAETAESKAIVVASVKTEDTSWVNKHFPDWQINTYVADDPDANNTVFKVKGREAAVYLTYIINHYYNLPDVVVFNHAGRYQWHNDDPMYDGVNPIKNLRLEHVKEKGYVSLRCNWKPGCPAEVFPTPNKPDGFWGWSNAYAVAWKQLFPDAPVPKEVGAGCCAQFAVSRERIHMRPVQFYEQLRQFLWTSKITGGKTGRVMEYLWHIIFKMPTKLCPDTKECYCQTYGLCNLTCEEGKCGGRYRLPGLGMVLPKQWPEQGQGVGGWPQEGWWEKFEPYKSGGSDREP